MSQKWIVWVPIEEKCRYDEDGDIIAFTSAEEAVNECEHKCAMMSFSLGQWEATMKQGWMLDGKKFLRLRRKIPKKNL